MTISGVYWSSAAKSPSRRASRPAGRPGLRPPHPAAAGGCRGTRWRPRGPSRDRSRSRCSGWAPADGISWAKDGVGVGGRNRSVRGARDRPPIYTMRAAEPSSRVRHGAKGRLLEFPSGRATAATYVARTVPGAYARMTACLPPRHVVRAHRAPAPVRLLHHLRAQDGRAPARRGHHRLRHGQPRRPDAARTSSTSSSRPCSAPTRTAIRCRKGIPRLRRAICHWYKRRCDVEFDPETEAIVTIGSQGGHRAPGARHARPRRHGAGAQSELSDPHLRAGDRRRRHPPGADDARRGLLRRARAHDPRCAIRSRRC